MGHAKQSNTLVWSCRNRLMLWGDTKHWFDHWHWSEGRVGPTETDLWVWDCERRVSAVTESCGRERLTGQRRCVTPMMLVTTSDNPRGLGPGITDSSPKPHPPLLAAHTGPFLTGCKAACVISLSVCHMESKSLLSITAALLSTSRIYRSSGCSFKFMTWRQETFGQVKN